MPTPFDLLSSELEEEDPDDQLRNMLGQDQGKNLVGGPEANPDGKVSPPPGQGGVRAMPAKPCRGAWRRLSRQAARGARQAGSQRSKPRIRLKEHVSRRRR